MRKQSKSTKAIGKTTLPVKIATKSTTPINALQIRPVLVVTLLFPALSKPTQIAAWSFRSISTIPMKVSYDARSAIIFMNHPNCIATVVTSLKY
jgi:hypothetical protein